MAVENFIPATQLQKKCSKRLKLKIQSNCIIYSLFSFCQAHFFLYYSHQL